MTEPNAGSDVAQIRTTAERSNDGTHYIVNGSKKWITNGVYADYITAVVRTGPSDSGAAGISVLVIPLDLDGVERKLLKNSGVNASGQSLVKRVYASLRVADMYPPSSLACGSSNGVQAQPCSPFRTSRCPPSTFSGAKTWVSPS